MNEVKVSKLGPFPKVNKPVFITSSVLIVGFIIFGSLFSETAATLFSFLQAFIAEKFRWLFIILFNMALVFCIYLTASRYGDIRLGKQTERPQYTYFHGLQCCFRRASGLDWCIGGRLSLYITLWRRRLVRQKP